MNLHIHPATPVFESPEQYAADEEFVDGDKFTLLRIEAVAANTYEVRNGVPVLVSVAFPASISKV